jgi:competence protein ComEA
MPELPISRRGALALAAVLLAALALAGRTLVGGGAPAPARPLVVEPAAREEAAPRVLVHVVGAVRRPGLYRLREGARVADAVARAGGETAKADLALINLAAPVADGAQVVVPRSAPPPAVVGGAGAGSAEHAASGPVHLNTATLEQLDALPGIGPTTAERILAYRQQHGAFSSVEELDAVPGIGPARLEQLRELVAP